MDETSKQVNVKRRYVSGSVKSVPVPTSPPQTHSAGETCWDSLPPELQEMVVEKLGDKAEVLCYRLVNSSWKRTVDKVLERRYLSFWTSWSPIENDPNIWEDDDDDDGLEEEDDTEDYVGFVLDLAIACGVPRLRPTWSYFEEHDCTLDEIIPTFDHHLPDIDNPKLGTSIPTNCLRIGFHDKDWPSGKMFEMWRRAQMLADFVVKYDHSFSYLKALLLTDIKISPSNLATVLGKLTSLKALTLEDAVLDVEPGAVNEEENNPLPPHQNLTHLRITSTNSSASELLLKAYHEQLICLETNFRVAVFSKPYGNLKILKLFTNLRLNALRFFEGAETHFPALKKLSFSIHDRNFLEWEELSQCIDTFPTTLINLHLDIKPRWETANAKIHKLTSSGVTFPNLKTLGVFFPATPQHAECLRRLILPKFPNLEKIALIDGYWRFLNAIKGGNENEAELDDNDHEGGLIWPNHKSKAIRNVERMVQELKFYATVCPKLQHIHQT